MKAVRVSIDLGPDARHRMHQFVVDHDGFEASRMLQVDYSDVGGDDFGVQTALFHVVGTPIESYEAALRETDIVVEYDIARDDDRSFYVYVRGEHTDHDDRLVAALRQAGLVGMMPIEFREDGTMRLTLIGPGETVQRALEELPDECTVDVRQVGEYDAGVLSQGGDLTDRQRAAVEAAVECGYYTEPRQGSVADVADELGCAPGTAAEHLRRAEANVMHDVVDRE